MAIARSEIVEANVVSTYHVIQRCVRRGYLCGFDASTGVSYEHRRGWIQDLKRELASIMAIEVGVFSIMANHFHGNVRIRPDLAAGWGVDELAVRWYQLYPKRRDPKTRLACTPTREELDAILAEKGGGEERAHELRIRLCSLSRFMKVLSERIARRANREDEVTGRFWQGRFTSVRLLDDEAKLACALYVDLNPIRAGVAQTPETSDYTSAKLRIEASQARKQLAAARDLTDPTAAQRRCLADAELAAGADDWLCPIGEASGYLPGLTLDGYLELLDWTGRQLARGKRGRIPNDAPPIAVRLQTDLDRWLEVVRSFGTTFRRAAGTVASMVKEAARVSRRWLHGVGAAPALG